MSLTDKILPLKDEGLKETLSKELLALVLALPDRCDVKSLMIQRIGLSLGQIVPKQQQLESGEDDKQR